jgi:hypothetical protein
MVSYYLMDTSCFKCSLRTHADFYFISLFLCIWSLDLSWTFSIIHLLLLVSYSSVSPFFIIVTHLRSLAQQLCSRCTVFNFIIPFLILCFILCFKGCGDDLYTIYIHTFEGGCPSVCPLVLHGLLPSTTLCDQPLASHQQLDLTLLSPIPFDLVV